MAEPDDDDPPSSDDAREDRYFYRRMIRNAEKIRQEKSRTDRWERREHRDDGLLLPWENEVPW